MTSPLKKRTVCLLIALMTACITVLDISAHAAGDVETMSLKESVCTTLEQSLVLKSMHEETWASAARKNEALTNFLPKLSTTWNYTHLNRDPWFPLIGLEPLFPDSQLPAGTKDNFTWAFEVKQPLFAGGALVSTYKASAFGYEAAGLDEQARMLDVVKQVKLAYYGILKAKHVKEVARQSVGQLEAHLVNVKNLFNQDMVPRNDVLYVEVELANSSKLLLKAENSVEMAKAQLNTILRRDINHPFEVEEFTETKPFESSYEECLKTAEEKRPEIKAARLKAKQAECMVDIARSGYYPTVGTIGHFERFGDLASLKGSEFKDKESWYAAVQAEWTFWEWGKTRSRVQEGRAMSNEAGYALAMITDQVRLEIKNAYLNLTEGRRQIDVAKKAAVQAEENFRIVREHYREQLATNTDVIDAQTLLTKTKTDYANALSDYDVSYAGLERAMGVLVPE